MTTRTLAAILLCATMQTGVGAQSPAPPAGLDAATRDALSQTVRGILVECLPERIEVRDDWGDTKRVPVGLTWRRDGLKLSVEKREADRKHGLWKQMEIVPRDPEKNLRFQIASAVSTGPRKFTFQILTASPLGVKARIERWRSGVKMLNFAAEADATVEMRLDGELEFEFQSQADGTFLALLPRITAVDLRLVEFDWQKIGKVDGAIVHELGDMLNDPIAKQLDKQEPKAVEKLNQAIAKRKDKWRIPVGSVFDLGDWSLPALTPSPPSK